MWIYYDPVFKQQTNEWVPRGSSFPLKQHTMKSKMKCMVITFVDWEDMVYAHTVPDGQIVADWNIKVLKRLITVHTLCKRPHYHNGQRKLHHNNTRPHIAQQAWDFLILHGMEVILHIPCSSKLTSYDFSCFLKVKVLMSKPSGKLGHNLNAGWFVGIAN